MNLEQKIKGSNSQFAQQLSLLKEKRFKGRLEINSPNGWKWKLYFYLGRLLWIDGGEADKKSWQRQLKQYCFQLDSTRFNALAEKNNSYQRQLTLLTYLQKQKINLNSIKELIETRAAEIFFDILQQETYCFLEYKTISFLSNKKIASMIEKPLVLIDSEIILDKSQLEWEIWMAKGLGFWSAHSLVYLIDYHSNLIDISPELVKILNGLNTVRDLAFLTQDNFIELTSYLFSYVERGLIEFKDFNPAC